MAEQAPQPALIDAAVTSAGLSRAAQMRVVFAAGLAVALSLSGDLTLYAVLPAYASALAFDLAGIGLLLSANRLVRLISNPVVGALADRLGRRRLMVTGLLTGALSTLLYVLASGFWLFLLGRLLWGISWSLIWIGAMAMVIDVTSASERGWGTGWLGTLYFLGLAVNPLLGGLLSDLLGFKAALSICAAIGACGFLMALAFLPETFHPSAGQSGAQPAPRLDARRALSAVGQAGRDLAHGWLKGQGETLAANFIYMLILFVTDGVLMSTLTLYLQRSFGSAVPVVGLSLPVVAAGGALLALRAVISGIASPLAGRWSDREGRRWITVFFGVGIAALGYAALALDGSPWLALLGVGLASLGSGTLVAVLPAIVSTGASGGNTRGEGRGEGRAIGWLNTSGDIGCAIAPLAAYALLSRLPLGTLYLGCAALLVTGLLAAWAGRRASRKCT